MAAQENSLHAFLLEHSRLLKNLTSPSSDKMSNHENFVNEVYKIYEQLRVRKIYKQDHMDSWVATTLAKVTLKEWALSCVVF